jgi:hypothetical protein
MSTKKLVSIVALTVLMTTGTATWGQRGVGDNEGLVRQAIETQRTAIEGTVKEIIIETCENTTGPFGIGMHLLLTTGEKNQYNVHLGPAVLIKDLVKPLEVGQSVTVQAFRTQKMPAGDLVAITLQFDGKTVRLRDENLRPTWAGGQGQFLGQYQASPELPRWQQWRQVYGRGYGRGRGYGAGFGRGMGRGCGWGWSNRMGYGRGRGGGRGQGRGLGYGYGARMCPWGAAPGYLQYYGWRR